MKTVLLIEDNLDIRENTGELLELNGYKVFFAAPQLDHHPAQHCALGSPSGHSESLTLRDPSRRAARDIRPGRISPRR